VTRVALVGSGPAGLYAAGQLLSDKERSVEVDVFDKLATPWGLVRYGVAPDHPKIKSVTRVYEKTAAKPGFRFHGNVGVGVDVSHEELASAYHAVLYAIGAAKDRKLGIAGEEFEGSHAATEFVAWYNGQSRLRRSPLRPVCEDRGGRGQRQRRPGRRERWHWARPSCRSPTRPITRSRCCRGPAWRRSSCSAAAVRRRRRSHNPELRELPTCMTPM
jgi:hypothetical protein